MSWTKRKAMLHFMGPAATSFINTYLSYAPPIPITNHLFHDLTTPGIPQYATTLGLGAKFIPTPPPLTCKEVEDAFTRFSRTLAVHCFFRDNPQQQDEAYNPKLRTPPSTWNPPLHIPIVQWTLNRLRPSALPQLASVAQPSQHHNGNSRVHQHIRAIEQRGDIKVVATDKNLGLAALDTTAYHAMVMTHLSDHDVYHHLGPASTTGPEIMAMMQEKQAHLLRTTPLSKAERKHITYEWRHTFPVFHALPKLHKSGTLKGRPIIGATNWYTTPASKVLDTRLNKMLHNAPAILTNSHHLVQQITGYPPSHCTMVTMDVTALYTNIRLQLLAPLLHEDPVAATLLEYVCSNNIFTYAGQLYQQRDGLAMGTNAAVQLANLYLARLLDPLFIKHPQVSRYWRYIDDLLLFFTGTADDLRQLHEAANNAIPGIRLTMETSNKEIPFLDVMLAQDHRGHIDTYIYQKPMNRFLYLPFHTAHPRSTLRGFVHGEILRFQRLNTTEAGFHLQVSKLAIHLAARGYPKSWTARIVAKTCKEATNSTTKTRPHFCQLVLRHTGANLTPWRNIYKEHEQALVQESGKHLRITTRISPSISRLLLRSDLSTEQRAHLGLAEGDARRHRPHF